MKTERTVANLLLDITEFVGSLHSWIEDGLWHPDFDLQQAHVDPEHSRTYQLVGALYFALDILLHAGDTGLYYPIGEQVWRQEVPEHGLDLLSSYQRVRILHQVLTALHITFLKAGRQQVSHALELPTQNGALEPEVCAAVEVCG